MADYETGPGILRINKDLGWAHGDELTQKCLDLVASNSPVLLIDIAGVGHVCSANLAILACAGAMAAKNNKPLKIRLSSRAARTFELAGFKNFASLEVV